MYLLQYAEKHASFSCASHASIIFTSEVMILKSSRWCCLFFIDTARHRCHSKASPAVGCRHFSPCLPIKTFACHSRSVFSGIFFFFFFYLPRRISRLQFDVSVWSLANANHKNRVGAARRRNPEGLINMSLKKNNERKNELMNRNVIEGVDKK